MENGLLSMRPSNPGHINEILRFSGAFRNISSREIADGSQNAASKKDKGISVRQFYRYEC